LIDCVLVNTAVSSPLHPQLNLPLLRSHLVAEGFSARIVDANIRFFHEFLGSEISYLTMAECDANPITLLEYYNDVEQKLADCSRAYPGLHVGLRSLAMKYDRLDFGSVVAAATDAEANPFVAHSERLVDEEIAPSGAAVIGIAITFQDQIIPAFTLAAAIRRRLPSVRIVLGGQIVTRCYDTMVRHAELRDFCDYLVLWDGEVPLTAILRREIRGEQTDMTNVIDVAADPATAIIRRTQAALSSATVPKADYSDIPFDQYLFPEMLVPLQTTRGCYAHCAFCAIPFGSNRYRVRGVEAVIEEMLNLQDLTEQRFGRRATYFKFMEDTSAPSMLRALAQEIERREMTVRWETFARMEEAFTAPGFLDQLYRGGCRKIHWGLETNDPAILAGMNKKVKGSCTNDILRLAAEAGIMNFCFILIGFPGESDEQRQRLTEYIIANPAIHTLTISTFDLTRRSPMDEDWSEDNPYGLDRGDAEDFQVRLPYTVHGQDWKKTIVPAAHRMMLDIVRERPDIGFVTLFPDQVRAMFCDKYGADWGRLFVTRYGEDNIRQMLLNTEDYVKAYESKMEIDVSTLPEPLKREHFRTKEDMALLARAVLRRRDYERRRIEQV